MKWPLFRIAYTLLGEPCVRSHCCGWDGRIGARSRRGEGDPREVPRTWTEFSCTRAPSSRAPAILAATGVLGPLQLAISLHANGCSGLRRLSAATSGARSRPFCTSRHRAGFAIPAAGHAQGYLTGGHGRRNWSHYLARFALARDRSALRVRHRARERNASLQSREASSIKGTNVDIEPDRFSA